jgi:uncharacterized protein YbjT (DUF2867 family)
MAELQLNFVRAVEAAGVGRVVQLSGQGADPRSPVRTLRWLGEVEEVLRRSRVAATHLRAATFMQNLLASAGEIAGAGTLSAPFDGTPVTFVDTRDVGAVGAAAMLGQGHEHQTYGVSGPERLPYGEVAQRFTRALGRPVRFRPISLQQARGGLEAAGLPAVMVEALVELWDFMVSGALHSPVTDAVERLTGAKPRGLDAFIADHAAAFAPAAPITAQ